MQQIINWSQSGSSVITLPYQCPPSRYQRRGKSAQRKLYSSLLVSTYSQQFSFFQSKPQLPHSWFSTPSVAVFLFFPGVASHEPWFSHHARHTGSVLSQNRSLSLFPLLTEDHRAKFNTNNKITGAQKYSLPHTERFNLTSLSYLYLTTLMCLCLGWGLVNCVTHCAVEETAQAY